jgi:acetylornithine deacetylase/succinyl-diaminopimelate desuccinylase-like protein
MLSAGRTSPDGGSEDGRVAQGSTPWTMGCMPPGMATMDVTRRADDVWARDVIPTLRDFIAIPNVSEAFEANWRELGHMDRAVALLRDWAQARPIEGMALVVHELEGRSPVLFLEIPAAGGGSADDTVLLYGHLDKQPEMTGWRDGLGPWEPVLDGDRLYGRGGADDGYALFAALTAVELAREAEFPHARCVVLIEASEESGSRDLPAHVEALADRIGTPSLVVCLDSGGLDYDRLWTITSLRGQLAGQLDVSILRDGVHSGDASGVVPSTFRIARSLLSRLEDEDSGEILLPAARVEIPPDRRAQAEATAAAMAAPLAAKFPFLDGARPVTDDEAEQVLNRSWRPMLEITGAGGLPPTERAGNVLRPATSLYLSLRLPPTADPQVANAALSELLTVDPPYGATVAYRADKTSIGWNAPPFEPWLEASLEQASSTAFGQPACAAGSGGSITFMGMLGARFPAAQFVVTGVLGPGSNAHGPNEFLHLPTARRLTAVVAWLLRDHARR